MIDAVLLFGVLNVAFEFILLGMIPPRRRLRLLGNETACTVMHISFLALNLLIHWVPLTGDNELQMSLRLLSGKILLLNKIELEE